MDPAAVRSLLATSLDPDADSRRRAELQLKQIEEQPGFLECLLNILQAEQESSVRLSSMFIQLGCPSIRPLCACFISPALTLFYSSRYLRKEPRESIMV
ncbi:hypothetical protein BKA59DRAFT_306750 [Fusarium tricinctum]|uniref:Importin N-terminal domain-containing protein n=1 Tax=Fusarium tricinctum TaxID=61284 RepID=A0A8K0W7U9_9HYPO|nr:hypothetical protein BKA59DRAFT_306750 [Fusarium tricinctum]